MLANCSTLYSLQFDMHHDLFQKKRHKSRIKGICTGQLFACIHVTPHALQLDMQHDNILKNVDFWPGPPRGSDQGLQTKI